MKRVTIYYKQVDKTASGFSFSTLENLVDMQAIFPELFAIMGKKFIQDIQSGKTILVNSKGGWCFEDEETSVVK